MAEVTMKMLKLATNIHFMRNLMSNQDCIIFE